MTTFLLIIVSMPVTISNNDVCNFFVNIWEINQSRTSGVYGSTMINISIAIIAYRSGIRYKKPE